eukprot:CAMPEP_0178603388 /NCGR_PEP_ID=MMETSP0697-20121206/35482_1 /TAXON_ID=265572 /ORGANISM="Extubocellulus spinifer, Strain CCMP396" /LENGTH=68 /DNA_ID=CAMNT_0020241685 /DNA_START=53 /DNA_END=259 /DNA_ORIENTATION=+
MGACRLFTPASAATEDSAEADGADVAQLKSGSLPGGNPPPVVLVGTGGGTIPPAGAKGPVKPMDVSMG